MDDDIILAAGVSEEMKLLALWVDFVEDGQQVELEVVGSAGFNNCGSVVSGVVGHGFLCGVVNIYCAGPTLRG